MMRDSIRFISAQMCESGSLETKLPREDETCPRFRASASDETLPHGSFSICQQDQAKRSISSSSQCKWSLTSQILKPLQERETWFYKPREEQSWDQNPCFTFLHANKMFAHWVCRPMIRKQPNGFLLELPFTTTRMAYSCLHHVRALKLHLSKQLKSIV